MPLSFLLVQRRAHPRIHLSQSGPSKRIAQLLVSVYEIKAADLVRSGVDRVIERSGQIHRAHSTSSRFSRYLNGRALDARIASNPSLLAWKSHERKKKSQEETSHRPHQYPDPRSKILVQKNQTRLLQFPHQHRIQRRPGTVTAESAEAKPQRRSAPFFDSSAESIPIFW